MNRWSGKVALVTGASSGIGAATVKALVHEGLRVVGVARRVANIKKIATELKDEKGALYARRCDLTREDEILEIFEWIKENFGGVDVLINNAEIIYPAGITDGDTEGFRRVLDVNVMAVAICTREAVQSMKSRNFDGHIINVNRCVRHVVIFFKFQVDRSIGTDVGSNHRKWDVASCGSACHPYSVFITDTDYKNSYTHDRLEYTH